MPKRSRSKRQKIKNLSKKNNDIELQDISNNQSNVDENDSPKSVKVTTSRQSNAVESPFSDRVYRSDKRRRVNENEDPNMSDQLPNERESGVSRELDFSQNNDNMLFIQVSEGKFDEKGCKERFPTMYNAIKEFRKELKTFAINLFEEFKRLGLEDIENYFIAWDKSYTEKLHLFVSFLICSHAGMKKDTSRERMFVEQLMFKFDPEKFNYSQQQYSKYCKFKNLSRKVRSLLNVSSICFENFIDKNKKVEFKKKYHKIKEEAIESSARRFNAAKIDNVKITKKSKQFKIHRVKEDLNCIAETRKFGEVIGSGIEDSCVKVNDTFMCRKKDVANLKNKIETFLQESQQSSFCFKYELTEKDDFDYLLKHHQKLNTEYMKTRDLFPWFIKEGSSANIFSDSEFVIKDFVEKKKINKELTKCFQAIAADIEVEAKLFKVFVALDEVDSDLVCRLLLVPDIKHCKYQNGKQILKHPFVYDVVYPTHMEIHGRKLGDSSTTGLSQDMVDCIIDHLCHAFGELIKEKSIDLGELKLNLESYSDPENKKTYLPSGLSDCFVKIYTESLPLNKNFLNIFLNASNKEEFLDFNFRILSSLYSHNNVLYFKGWNRFIHSLVKLDDSYNLIFRSLLIHRSMLTTIDHERYNNLFQMPLSPNECKLNFETVEEHFLFIQAYYTAAKFLERNTGIYNSNKTYEINERKYDDKVIKLYKKKILEHFRYVKRIQNEIELGNTMPPFVKLNDEFEFDEVKGKVFFDRSEVEEDVSISWFSIKLLPKYSSPRYEYMAEDYLSNFENKICGQNNVRKCGFQDCKKDITKEVCFKCFKDTESKKKCFICYDCWCDEEKRDKITENYFKISKSEPSVGEYTNETIQKTTLEYLYNNGYFPEKYSHFINDLNLDLNINVDETMSNGVTEEEEIKIDEDDDDEKMNDDDDDNEDDEETMNIDSEESVNVRNDSTFIEKEDEISDKSRKSNFTVYNDFENDTTPGIGDVRGSDSYVPRNTELSDFSIHETPKDISSQMYLSNSITKEISPKYESLKEVPVNDSLSKMMNTAFIKPPNSKKEIKYRIYYSNQEKSKLNNICNDHFQNKKHLNNDVIKKESQAVLKNLNQNRPPDKPITIKHLSTYKYNYKRNLKEKSNINSRRKTVKMHPMKYTTPTLSALISGFENYQVNVNNVFEDDEI